MFLDGAGHADKLHVDVTTPVAWAKAQIGLRVRVWVRIRPE